MMKRSSPGLPAVIRGWVLTCVFVAFGLFGCAPTESGGGPGGTGATGGTGGSGSTSPLVVTADWLNQSLTLLDYDKLIDGESDAAASIVGTIDLSDWEPGPLEIELTPDGKTAVVSVGPGFFDGGFSIIGSPDVPPGGTLLVVDLETGEAESIETEHVPMGIAISPDGALAYTANYGTTDAPGDSLSVIDIATRSVVEEILEIGFRPEQVALSLDGMLGAINITSAGGVRVFQTSDIAGTLTDIVATANDPSDLTFLDGNDRLVVANSLGFNVTLLDTSNPSAPLAIQSFIVQGGVPYGLTFVPSRGSILAPLSLAAGLPANLSTIVVDGDILRPSLPQALPGSSFPLTAAVDANGDFAFVAHVSDNQFSIIDLETGATRAISWLAEPGPTYVAVQR